jgi:RTX calcium-binding nonapeptide repeat (4 copies)/IPT/TIG domain
MRVRLVAVVLALAAVSVAVAAGGGVTTIDASGTVVLDGQKIFPIVLAKGPPPDGTTPTGGNAIAEVVAAGVNFLKVGPATVPWTAADIDEAKLENQAASAHGAHTWINLATLSRATAGSPTDTLLANVVTSLEQDPSGTAIGMWKGADEPWWSGVAPSGLQFAFCRATGRGQASWCGGEPVLDRDHLWVTVQAPRGTSADLAPYAAVTDVHGVDVYPVTAANPTPDLRQVGNWTSTIAAVTPSHAVWTTLQICASGSVGTGGSFVLPTRAQERFMIYDAIINGARSLAFYGGNNPDCWNATDTQHSWSWTFWDSTLRSLISEIGASSALAPALVDPASTTVLPASDTTTEVVRRDGNSGDVWVLAARSGTGTAAVTISGLPASAASASVYTEGRSVPVANGSLTDNFAQWDVHVYHVVAQAPPPPAPAISSIAPTSGPVGTRVTIGGTNLGDATAVAFGGVPAGFTLVSNTALSATVPAGAVSGPISVTTPGGTATSTGSFTVGTAAPPPPPAGGGGGGGGSGGGAVPSDLRVTLSAGTSSASLGATDEVTVTSVDAGGGSSHVLLTITLPPGLQLAGAPAYERGSGCRGDTVVVCDLDFLEAGMSTRVRFSVRATAAGEQQIAASIAAREADAHPADNSAVLAITVPAAVAPAKPHATQGADRLVGTRGRDLLYGLGGADTILGLAGNDLLDGGAGNDTLVGGPGRDTLFGRSGNDVLSIRDGQRDRVSCGPGRDRVIADRIDLVARDCERVVRR